jgi:hypothetical protein
MAHALQIFCGCCGVIFYICKECYKGQKYCTDECCYAAYLEAHSKAQREYRQKKKGKQQHCDAEKRRRLRKKEEKNKNLNIGMKTCMCFAMLIKTLFFKCNPLKKKGNCIICGKNLETNEEYIEVIDSYCFDP